MLGNHMIKIRDNNDNKAFKRIVSTTVLILVASSSYADPSINTAHKTNYLNHVEEQRACLKPKVVVKLEAHNISLIDGLPGAEVHQLRSSAVNVMHKSKSFRKQKNLYKIQAYGTTVVSWDYKNDFGELYLKRIHNHELIINELKYFTRDSSGDERYDLVSYGFAKRFIDASHIFEFDNDASENLHNACLNKITIVFSYKPTIFISKETKKHSCVYDGIHRMYEDKLNYDLKRIKASIEKFKPQVEKIIDDNLIENYKNLDFYRSKSELIEKLTFDKYTEFQKDVDMTNNEPFDFNEGIKKDVKNGACRFEDYYSVYRALAYK